MEQLTRDYFASHGYEITYRDVELGGNKYTIWEAKLTRDMHRGHSITAMITVDNYMYPEEFSVRGTIGNNFAVNWITIKTVEDLEKIYDLAGIKYTEGGDFDWK